MPGVYDLGVADCCEHALGRGGVHQAIPLAGLEIVLKRHFLFARLLVTRQEIANDIHGSSLLYRSSL